MGIKFVNTVGLAVTAARCWRGSMPLLLALTGEVDGLWCLTLLLPHIATCLLQKTEASFQPFCFMF